MNIDLLFTRQGEAGLICSENLVKKAMGVLFDASTGLMSLEFVDMDHMDLNIPVDQEFFGMLDMCSQLHIGAVKNGNIAQAYQLPLMFLDDPYRAEALQNIMAGNNSLEAFNYFVKACVTGQPLHRDDLGADDTMGCVLGDASPASLEFAPHLARRHAMEISPKNAPQGPAGPSLGLGGSGGGGGSVQQSTTRRGSGKTDGKT